MALSDIIFYGVVISIAVVGTKKVYDKVFNPNDGSNQTTEVVETVEQPSVEDVVSTEFEEVTTQNPEVSIENPNASHIDETVEFDFGEEDLSATEESPFISKGNLSFYKGKHLLPGVMLVDFAETSIGLNRSVYKNDDLTGNYDIQIATFQTPNGDIVLATDRVYGMARGRMYDLEYDRLSEDRAEPLNHRDFFKALYGRHNYDVTFSQPMDPNIEGIITSLKPTQSLSFKEVNQ